MGRGWRYFRFFGCGVIVSMLSATVFPGAFGQESGSTPPQLGIKTSSLGTAFVSQAYHVQLEAEGGTTPYKWSLTSGALPNGLSLGHDGVISGIPAEAGQFHFVVSAIDSEKPAQERTQDLVLPVLAPLLAKWNQYPKVNGQRIEGSLKVSNQTDD